MFNFLISEYVFIEFDVGTSLSDSDGRERETVSPLEQPIGRTEWNRNHRKNSLKSSGFVISHDGDGKRALTRNT